MQRAYLTLADGCVYSGFAFGYPAEPVGELVFTTAMTGYLETLTDPSYYGQMVVQAFPLIGNYGVIPEDFESHAPMLSAYIVRDLCTVPSNFRSSGTLDDFLREQKIPGIYGIDTRSLIRRVREAGTMNAKITLTPPDVQKLLPELQAYAVRRAVLTVNEAERAKSELPASGCDREVVHAQNPLYRVALWDFGAKGNIARCLATRGCEVTIFPASTKAEELFAFAPDGIMLSNGPGDPAENTDIIAEIARVFTKKIPTFGICLGHQLAALAVGAKTEKLKYGHRGANQPVCRTVDGRVFITSQNHGYAVTSSALPKNARESFRNANDGTCEGVDYLDLPVFTVQFHPEACGGPRDTGFLFDRFVAMMEGGRTNA